MPAQCVLQTNQYRTAMHFLPTRSRQAVALALLSVVAGCASNTLSSKGTPMSSDPKAQVDSMVAQQPGDEGTQLGPQHALKRLLERLVHSHLAAPLPRR